ncbi:phosphatase PAP2 family protein [Halobacterium wangiae]|uniref:phosphatase PAP2 family protein n=1 Tax=Halobacterium wangiae TaxID=2902623 RepID=UPI001E436749|nr:phosphatase PAP2 family protein [Halobacterium wangiae]
MTGRGIGVAEAIAGSVPGSLVVVLAVLTFLGSTWLITTLGPAVYLFGPRRGLLSRRDGARLLAVSIGALALVVLLKGLFDVARPPETVMLIAEEGNGFPSGHATGAAAFYGGLAALVGVGTRVRRLLAAAGMVAFVSFTRLALGVHYLVDVVAGAALGAAFVGVLLALTRRRVGYGFGVAFVTAVAAVVLVGPHHDAMAALGGTAGVLVGWWLVTERDALERPVRTVPTLVALALLGSAAAATLALDAPIPAVVAAHVAAGVGFVGLPALQKVSRYRSSSQSETSTR